MSLTDIVIHIDETMDEFDLQAAEDAVAECRGVISAHVSPSHPHLMLVVYDPERMRATTALAAIQGLGLHGQMIGL